MAWFDHGQTRKLFLEKLFKFSICILNLSRHFKKQPLTNFNTRNLQLILNHYAWSIKKKFFSRISSLRLTIRLTQFSPNFSPASYFSSLRKCCPFGQKGCFTKLDRCYFEFWLENDVNCSWLLNVMKNCFKVVNFFFGIFIKLLIFIKFCEVLNFAVK